MKKLLAVLAVILLFSFQTEKKYKVELSIEQWQQVINVIDESNASNLQVKAVKSWIIQPLQEQLKDSSKTK